MAGAYVAELIGFAIFVVIIGWKVVPAVQRMLDRRRETIRSSLDAAAAALSAAEAELARRTELLGEARSEAEAILAQAAATREQLEGDGRRRAEQEYERMVQDAEAEIVRERQRAREEVSAEIGEIVLDAAEQVVRAELDAERQRTLVDEVIDAARSAEAVR